MAARERLSAHFFRDEFDCRDGSESSPSRNLIERLEVLRSICGAKPLHIVSGYRSAAHNKAVGGATRSQHLYNTAADIPAGYATLAQARRAGFRGIGLRADWVVHVDVRPSAVTVWRY